MGLTKEQIKDRAIQRFKDFMDKYAIDMSKYKIEYSRKDLGISNDDTKRVIEKVWDKEVFCAQDMCIYAAVMFDNGDIVFCDFCREAKPENSGIDQPKRSRFIEDFTTNRINEILTDLCELEHIDSVVPVRKKPEHINHYKKYGR